MHEYGVAQEIVSIACEKAESHAIKKISLRIGDLSGIVAESLTMYIELIFCDKQMAPPAVSIQKVLATLRCACGVTYCAEKMFDPCPACGSFERTIIDGTECTIESIEVEDE